MPGHVAPIFQSHSKQGQTHTEYSYSPSTSLGEDTNLVFVCFLMQGKGFFS